jgi:hypothetical protein
MHRVINVKRYCLILPSPLANQPFRPSGRALNIQPAQPGEVMRRDQFEHALNLDALE